tara:strand:- start:380 stop:688 length:309 start_codon:yes stop_codon:yes gene_type:complete
MSTSTKKVMILDMTQKSTKAILETYLSTAKKRDPKLLSSDPAFKVTGCDGTVYAVSFTNVEGNTYDYDTDEKTIKFHSNLPTLEQFDRTLRVATTTPLSKVA